MPSRHNHILNGPRLCRCYQNTYAKCSDSYRPPKLFASITLFAYKGGLILSTSSKYSLRQRILTDFQTLGCRACANAN